MATPNDPKTILRYNGDGLHQARVRAGEQTRADALAREQRNAAIGRKRAATMREAKEAARREHRRNNYLIVSSEDVLFDKPVANRSVADVVQEVVSEWIYEAFDHDYPSRKPGFDFDGHDFSIWLDGRIVAIIREGSDGKPVSTIMMPLVVEAGHEGDPFITKIESLNEAKFAGSNWAARRGNGPWLDRVAELFGVAGDVLFDEDVNNPYMAVYMAIEGLTDPDDIDGKVAKDFWKDEFADDYEKAMAYPWFFGGFIAGAVAWGETNDEE